MDAEYEVLHQGRLVGTLGLFRGSFWALHRESEEEIYRARPRKEGDFASDQERTYHINAALNQFVKREVEYAEIEFTLR
jgi:hypothetical protein